jgi:monofunctional glycosyltransferase
VIEMGDGVYGAQAAAKEYFKKDAKNLSKGEAAMIAACLPNPRRWTPKSGSNYVFRKQQWILRQMSNFGGKVKFD